MKTARYYGERQFLGRGSEKRIKNRQRFPDYITGYNEREVLPITVGVYDTVTVKNKKL